MKYALAVLMVLGSQMAVAAGANDTITCTPLSCHDVEGPQGGAYWCPTVLDKTPFELNLANFKASQNSARLEWAPGDGDQYTLYALEVSKTTNLQPGQSFNGSVSDAYWWADGDHIRSTTELSCTKN